MIYFGGISIALFISALLLNKRSKSKSDIFLFIWMLLMAVHLFLFYIDHTGQIYNWPHLLAIETPLPLFHGVFLYFYVSSVTNQFPKNNWMAALHLLPAIFGYTYLTNFFLLSGAQKIEVFGNRGEEYETFRIFGLALIFISGIAYVFWSNILLIKHRKNIRDQFSDIEEINLKWLQFLTYGLGGIWSVVILTNNDTYIFIGVSVFVILIGFFGVQQRVVFNSKTLVLDEVNMKSSETKTKKEKYAKSGLTDKLAEDLYKNLMKLMIEEGLYKDSTLSLNDLASKLDVHPNYLSQTINEKERKNFYDFVNTFRVEEFKRLVKINNNQQFTLLALAYDCGFNSKSSFNRYFKKRTGKTPSQYAKSAIK
ncbi:helix-turn-helix domain-containing protein [Aquimarina macrocephali]|uniref:helix-turn-helix domain-containing protein n=1 Tax=Aquimarina macrocephali TaxID=666563 RepID=UPI00046581DC|nr:helix-turn-helix domain-containing protein [Aquimarina macrocephali]